MTLPSLRRIVSASNGVARERSSETESRSRNVFFMTLLLAPNITKGRTPRQTNASGGGVLIFSLRNSAVLRVSAVYLFCGFFTAESQRPPRGAENAAN